MITIGFPTRDTFSKAESHLRSKLEEKVGAPMIYINDSDSHGDYKRRFESKSAKPEDQLRYIFDLCAKEIANLEVKKAVENRVIPAEEAARRAFLRAEEIKYGVLKSLGLK